VRKRGAKPTVSPLFFLFKICYNKIIMTKAMYFFIILAVLFGLISVFTKNETSDSVQVVESEDINNQTVTEDEGQNSEVDLTDFIIVSNLEAETVIESPLTVSGEARGYWFFEGSFPVELKNGDGVVIATGIATSTEEWMTTEFIPFSVTLEFVNPYNPGDPEYWKKGLLVLKRDNPSDLPENDQELEIPIYFEP